LSEDATTSIDSPNIIYYKCFGDGGNEVSHGDWSRPRARTKECVAEGDAGEDQHQRSDPLTFKIRLYGIIYYFIEITSKSECGRRAAAARCDERSRRSCSVGADGLDASTLLFSSSEDGE